MSQPHAPHEILEAASVDFGACDFCNAVHINLMDGLGRVFATASLPVDLEQAFIDRFKATVALVKGRAHPAPARRQ